MAHDGLAREIRDRHRRMVFFSERGRPQRFLNGHAHVRRPAHGLNGHIELSLIGHNVEGLSCAGPAAETS